MPFTFSVFWFAKLLSQAMIAILFVQSGLDKATDYNGNLAWLQGHFAATFLKNMVPLMLTVVMIVELGAGVCSVIAIAEMLIGQDGFFAALGSGLGATAIVMLFFGQRIAKDYAGAASLVPYFLLCLVSLYLCG